MLHNKTVIITGSSRGIGLDIAKYFSREKANIVLNARKDISQDIIQELEKSGSKVLVVLGDVSHFDTAKELIETTKEVFGSVDILINNAGITKDNLIMRMSEKDFDDVINVNLKGTFNTIHFASKIMLKQRSGVIINVSSVIGLTGNIGQSNYAASKAGVIGLTKSVAKELAPRGITCNAIAPGFIETDMTHGLSNIVIDNTLAHIPLKKLGKTSDVAEAVLFLAKQPYITGQVINIDGGMVMNA